MPIEGVRRVDHIAIVVRDIDIALTFYRDVLGITPGIISDFPSEGVRIAFLPIGGPEGTKIELLQPINPQGSIARFLEKHGEGQHHICLEVADIDAALAGLQDLGAPVLDTVPRASVDGRAVFIHPKGAQGVLVELVEQEHQPA